MSSDSTETKTDQLVAIALDLASQGQSDPARRLLAVAKEMRTTKTWDENAVVTEENDPEGGQDEGKPDPLDTANLSPAEPKAPIGRTAPIRTRPKKATTRPVTTPVRTEDKPERTTLTLDGAEVCAEVAAHRALSAEDTPAELLAAHLIGLAELYDERGEISAAIESLETAKAHCPYLPGAFKLHGKMLFQAKDFDAATRELSIAFTNNPFDLEVAELLGRIHLEQGEYEEAVAATIDAFLLLGDEYSRIGSRLRRRIRTLKKLLRWSNKDLIEAFHQRREALTGAFDRLQSRESIEVEEGGLLDSSKDAPPNDPEKQKRMEIAARLRALEIWSPLENETIFSIADLVSEENPPPGTQLFEFRSSSRDIYFLERGYLEINRPTPYGELRMQTLETGELVGEINFVSPAGRSASARTIGDCRLLRIDAEGLEKLVEEQPDFGVELYGSFWHSLAQKIRSANERLTHFFELSGAAVPASLKHDHSGGIDLNAQDSPVVEMEEKLRVFSEQGLTHNEIHTLATFSRELQFRDGSYLFREGDFGDEMYIVLDGRIRISKFIPGGGEEALEIVERGGFFGEISLVDGQPRSADAKAHGGNATVLALDQRTVSEVLSMDPQASLEFLMLLCRLLASRLRELDEKLVLWNILQGPEAANAPERNPERTVTLPKQTMPS